ncbi:MAG TPA: arylsulfatase [Acidimicrobiales bacterium]|jgi:arylsulfatase A-like enzyme|nr:arylsulfatase [Acidimicrobiales bacterium]
MTRPERFEGRIGRTIADSEPWFDERAHPGEDAPNVVVILLDDTGFAQLGCYGSTIDTPNIDALASGGVQFTNFHVTPLCSPTRAALLTGRSHHMAGMRNVSNFRTGFPNMLGHMSSHTATMAEVLREAGYATFAVGKWHLAPMEECSAAGPFDHWPLGRGFDRFYGFLEGETDQFHPELVVDNHMIEPPARSGDGDGYHLSEDLVDQALRMIADSKGIRPDRPFFTYLAFGATHAPHQAPAAYLEKYRGAFDEGWDVVRQRWFERQLELGVIPPNTVLSPRNPGVNAWDDMSDDERVLAARLQEAFAAFLDHTDDQIGRFVDGLRRLGQLDNTLLMFLTDNGASQEGGPLGVLHEMKFFNGILEQPSEAVKRLDDIGGPHSHTNYPWGWAQTGNCPFRWYKQNTHEGGVHVPMIVHWPHGVGEAQRGTMRHQFAYVSDIAPTIYELLGVQAPGVFRGVEQKPVTGHSFVEILRSPDAPAANALQYFEMAGSRALVSGNWKAVCRHVAGADFDTEQWELYDLVADPSECNDLAARDPERLRELVDLWWQEAERHEVLPLDERTIELFGARFRDRSPHPASKRYVYRPPMSPMSAQAAAAVGGRSFDLTATVELTRAEDEGVLFATGTENSGISVFVQDGRLVLDYNAFDDHVIVESAERVPVGQPCELQVRVRRRGRDGSASVAIDGIECGAAELPLFMRMISSVGPTIGYDHGSAVSQRYQAPFPFTGRLDAVVIQLLERDPSAAVAARAEMSRQ